MNVSATLNAFKLIQNPSLCLPQATISTFNHLPIPVSLVFGPLLYGQKPDIRAVVLDKDDCFAAPGENVVYKPYDVRADAFIEVLFEFSFVRYGDAVLCYVDIFYKHCFYVKTATLQ